MEKIYKWLGNKEQAKELWQNEESLEKYLTCLKDFWDEENQCWLDTPNTINKKAPIFAGGKFRD